MLPIYYINKQHEINFKKTLIRWSKANKDSEYKTACYILAIPVIFEKVEEYLSSFEYPVSWIYEYLESDTENEIPYDLTGSMIQLGKFSLNMWNGYKDFNLVNCIAALDKENYNAVKCAMDIRMRKVE